MCTLPNNSTCYSNTRKKNGLSVWREGLKNMKVKFSTERTKHRLFYSWQWCKSTFTIMLGEKKSHAQKKSAKGPILQNRKQQLNATCSSLNICGGFLIHVYNLLSCTWPDTSEKKDNKGHRTVVDGQEESPAGLHGGTAPAPSVHWNANVRRCCRLQRQGWNWRKQML